jgi:hypothetical protein
MGYNTINRDAVIYIFLFVSEFEAQSRLGYSGLCQDPHHANR